MQRFYPHGSLRMILGLAVACMVALAASPVLADEEDWPVQIDVPKGTIVIYQPQVETFKNNELTGRAAVSVTLSGKTEPVFGAVWMKARVDTDRDTRMVRILDLKVSRARFAEATPDQEKQLVDIIEKEFPKWNLNLSLDRLLASLDVAEKEQAAAENLKSTPPKIIFVDYPAVLVMLEGEAELQPVEDSGLMRVVNTPFLIVLVPKKKRYYLDGSEIWYVAEDVKGPWLETENVPAEVVELRPPQSPEEVTELKKESESDTEDSRVPSIIVATEPTELIVSDGKPKYTPIKGNELLYMSNTESDVLLEIETQRYFVVLSGRWYASKSLSGPWTHVPSDQLPASFAKIPPDSEMSHVLTFVAGTKDAKEAVLDSQIPQTAAVKRSEAKLTVTYDGKPKFEKIEGTDIKYAVNTSYSVIKVKKKYYACHQAVWFVADDPLGPWIVADEIPKEIYTIPPSSPVYNVKYVYIYDSTPDVVYVGYTQGYVGSYVYVNTIVYGTGWYYPAWYGTYYYPRPATWGFHVRWNPWYGWSFGLSYSTGRFTFTFGFGGWYRGGWWGPVGYRGYRRGYHRGARAGYRAGYRAGKRESYRKNNLYNRPENRTRNVKTSQRADRKQVSTAAKRQNNVYADRNGNVHRRTEDGWQKRESNSWKESEASRDRSRPSERPSGDASRSSGDASRSSVKSGGQSRLERDHQVRQRGNNRTTNYRQSRGRGGGGRRR